MADSDAMAADNNMATDDTTAATSPSSGRDVIAAQGSLSHPLKLFTPMVIPPDASISTLCASQIEISTPVLIWSATPITITSMTQQSTWIASHAQLGPEFTRGWNNLPTELKVRVLSFDLLHSKVFDVAEVESSIQFDLYYYLRMTPEIAALAKEIFYKGNIFRIAPSKCTRFSLRVPKILHYPEPIVNVFIRKLEFQMLITRKDWQYIERLVDGVYGFNNVRSVKIIICWDFDNYKDQQWRAFLADMVGDGISFKCKGEVVFDRTNAWHTMSLVELDNRENALRTKISFGE